MSRHMHLISFQIHSPINHTVNSWAAPNDNRLEALGSYAAWQDLARTLEKGRFDAVFFADGPGVFDVYKDSPDDAIRYGVCWPGHDPMAVVPVMALATEHLGFAVTLSVSATPPYSLVRNISTFDYLSGGRAGWNVVTGHLRGEHRALGQEQAAHDNRYDRADEYMEICRKLWDGIKPGAILEDRKNGIYADPALVDRINHEGTYFRCNTVSSVLPSAQGRPVIFQAGSSGRGLKFALKHAEVTFTIQPDLSAMQTYMGKMKAAASNSDRTDPMRVSFGVQPILGGTEEEAKRIHRDIYESIPIEGAMARFSASLGVDFSAYDLDKPIDEIDTEASRGFMQVITTMMRGDGKMTLRDAATRWGMSLCMPPIIGTPEQVADKLIHLWRETGCIGFNITPTINAASVVDFVDQVTPILQKKGALRRDYAAKTLRGNLTDDE